MMARPSITAGQQAQKPYVDRKLSAMLTAMLGDRRGGKWYVYLAYDRCQTLRYVGQSGILIGRLSQHKTSGRLGDPAYQQANDWADLVAISCWNAVQVQACERSLIHLFHPPDNKKCERPGCRHYLDGNGSAPVNRRTVTKNLRGLSIVTPNT